MACGQTSANAASEHKDPERINVMFLCDEWKSSKGGLSTFNREFAVNLAKTTSDSIKVHCYVSQSDELCREDARQHGVNLITARSIPGSTDPLDWLKIPPPELSNPDIVIGHGRKFGTPAYCIVQTAKCKWVHFVHVFCEDLGKYKVTQSASLDTIEENEKKHKSEIELCKAADLVVAVGSRLQQKYSRSLPNVNVEIITPGILEKFSNESSQLVKDRSVVKSFNVFMFGRASFEDLTLKGYDIIANAIGSLDPKMFELTFVGSSPGEHRKIEQWFLDNSCISRDQIRIRSYCNEQDELKTMFHESDMIVLPSRTEGFGLIALEAISAGIPVLFAGKSGIAQALQKVEGGMSVIVESDDAGEWAQRIKQLSNQSPGERQNSAKLLKENYCKTYSWSNECERFKRIIQELVEGLNETSAGRQPAPDDNGYPLPEQQPAADEGASAEVEVSEETADTTALKIKIDVETVKLAEHNTQNRTPASATESGGSPELRCQERSAAPLSSGHAHPLSTGAEVLQTPNLTSRAEELFLSIVSNYLQTTPPRSMDDHNNFLAYAEKMRFIITGVRVGSLLITVKCESLKSLEGLWEDYSSGHLGEVVQRCFVTEEILMELNLTKLKLKTTILEEEYEACKMHFEKESTRGQCESVVGQKEIPAHSSGEKILTETDDDFQTQTDYGKLETGTDEDDFVSDDEGQEFLSLKKLTKAMDNNELRQFVSIYVEEGLWQVVALVLKELLLSQRLLSSIIFKSNEDVESDVDKTGTLTWWPVEEDQDLVTLCKVLTESDCRVDSVRLQNKLITDEGVKHLAEALTHNNCKLNSLNLSFNGKITDEGVKHLAEALTHNNCKLNSLDLSGNDKITDEGVKHLAEALTHNNCKLNSLYLRRSQITDEGVKHLAEALTHNNCKLNSLNLSFNGKIADEGVKHLAESLTHNNCKLNSLNLSFNGKITDEGVKHLAEALTHNNCNLNSLELSGNDKTTDEGVKHLVEALTHNNCKLSSLDLRFKCKITDEGVKHLTEALTHNNCKLNSLDLSGNGKITDEGVKHLAEALTHNNCTLNSLDLSGNSEVTDEGVKHLAEALTHCNCKLNSLDLSFNGKITDEGVKHLAEALRHNNCKLNSLILSRNSKITDEGVKQLAEALTHSNYEVSPSFFDMDIKVTAK